MIIQREFTSRAPLPPDHADLFIGTISRTRQPTSLRGLGVAISPRSLSPALDSARRRAWFARWRGNEHGSLSPFKRGALISGRVRSRTISLSSGRCGRSLSSAVTVPQRVCSSHSVRAVVFFRARIPHPLTYCLVRRRVGAVVCALVLFCAYFFDVAGLTPTVPIGGNSAEAECFLSFVRCRRFLFEGAPLCSLSARVGRYSQSVVGISW